MFQFDIHVCGELTMTCHIRQVGGAGTVTLTTEPMVANTILRFVGDPTVRRGTFQAMHAASDANKQVWLT